MEEGELPRSVSVLIPTWNGEPFLERVLAALATQETSLLWDVLAVDSGSTDGTLEVLHDWAKRFPVPLHVRQIDPTSFNHGDTRNLLAAESTGELLVFLTQDAIPIGPAWLATLAKNFDTPRVGAAYCRNVPRPDASVLTKTLSEGDLGYHAGRREQLLPDAAVYAAMGPDERRALFNLNDVASAFRRSLWERHPFPRADFGEDILMARAFIEAGYVVVYDDAATVEHSHDYDAQELRARGFADGKFNIEWLDRRCVASQRDAAELTNRQLQLDRRALVSAGIEGRALEQALDDARPSRLALFEGLFEGGQSSRRYPAASMLSRTTLRILYVVHGFPPDTWAGTEVYTLGLALEMKRRGHSVGVLARSPADRTVEEGGPEDFSLAHDEFRGVPVWRMTNRLRQSRLRDSFDQPKAEGPFRAVLAEVEGLQADHVSVDPPTPAVEQQLVAKVV